METQRTYPTRLLALTLISLLPHEKDEDKQRGTVGLIHFPHRLPQAILAFFY